MRFFVKLLFLAQRDILGGETGSIRVREENHFPEFPAVPAVPELQMQEVYISGDSSCNFLR